LAYFEPFYGALFIRLPVLIAFLGFLDAKAGGSVVTELRQAMKLTPLSSLLPIERTLINATFAFYAPNTLLVDRCVAYSSYWKTLRFVINLTNLRIFPLILSVLLGFIDFFAQAIDAR